MGVHARMRVRVQSEPHSGCNTAANPKETASGARRGVRLWQYERAYLVYGEFGFKPRHVLPLKHGANTRVLANESS